MEPDIIISGGTIITMVQGEEPIEGGSVVIKDGRIKEIRRGRLKKEDQVGRARVIDAGNAIVMPGLINSHTHAAMTLFRGLADDIPLKRWLFEKIFPAESRFLNPDTVYQGALLGCLEMIASGTTSFVDGYFFQDDTARAVYESGMRAVLAQGIIDYPAPGVENPGENLEVAKAFIERWLGYSDLITPGMFCHSPLTCSERTLRQAWEFSSELGLPLQIHLSETFDEVKEIVEKTGKRPVHYLEDLGLLDKGLIAAHAVHLNDGEIESLGASGCKVVHAPESNMKLGSGVARVKEMLENETVVVLGTDGCCSNNDLDMFLEMDTAAKLSKVFSEDPVSLDAEEVLKMATVRGASVMGLKEELGAIQVGKLADIIVVDTHRPHLVPIYDPVSAIVYSANGSDVRDVIVNGRILMKDWRFTTLDMEDIMEKVRRISEGIEV